MHRRLSLSVTLMLTLFGGTVVQAGPITLHTTSAVGATNVPIPNWSAVFGSTCGSPVGQTGSGTYLSIGFGGNALSLSGTLCIFDEGAVIPMGNTDPALMIGNTIVANGEDDYTLVFDQPITSLGLRLLTNYAAIETVTFRDQANNVIDVWDLDPFTTPNTRHFFGFSSPTPFASVFIDTEGGATQNEGIDRLEVGGARPSPIPARRCFCSASAWWG